MTAPASRPCLTLRPVQSFHRLQDVRVSALVEPQVALEVDPLAMLLSDAIANRAEIAGMPQLELLDLYPFAGERGLVEPNADDCRPRVIGYRGGVFQRRLVIDERIEFVRERKSILPHFALGRGPRRDCVDLPLNQAYADMHEIAHQRALKVAQLEASIDPVVYLVKVRWKRLSRPSLS